MRPHETLFLGPKKEAEERLPSIMAFRDELLVLLILLMEEILHQLVGRLSHYFQVVQDFFHQQ